MNKLLLLLGVISHLLLTSTSLAQENAGTIYGTVISEFNESIPLSTVVLLKESQIAAGIITDDQGNFILGEIESGTYDLKISSVGFSSMYIRDIEIAENQIHIPPIQLKWGVFLSSVVCESVRPLCYKPCGYGCICECVVPPTEYKHHASSDNTFTKVSVDTTSFLALESWRP